MKLSSAISQKITKICIENNISLNELANRCCLTQSTLQSLVEEKYTSPQVITIVRICDGLNIELKDFFNDSLFTNIDRED